jgi:hypothetical protein
MNFWYRVTISDPYGAVKYKTSATFHIFWGTTTKVYKAPDYKSEWISIRNMSGPGFNHAIYEIINNGQVMAKIIVVGPKNVRDRTAIEVHDSSDRVIGTIHNEDEILRGLSYLVYGNYALYDTKNNVLATIKHENHSSGPKLSKSTTYEVTIQNELTNEWELILITASILATTEELKPAPTKQFR